jgi:hypothetical protein
MGKILMLNNVRLSYPKLEEPEYFKGEKQKATDKRRWSASFHVLNTDPQKKLIDDAIREVAEGQWEKKFESILANILPDPKGCCWTDGARKDAPGVYILATHRTEDKQRPVVLDSDRSSIFKKINVGKDASGKDVWVTTNEIAQGKAGRIYSGMYVNAHVEIWAQQNDSGKGIRATLLGIQRFKDGDAFGGGQAPDEDAFGEITEGADAGDLY